MVLQLQLQHISILVIDLHLITDCLLADSLEMNWHDYTAAEIAIQLVILHVSLNYLYTPFDTTDSQHNSILSCKS